MKQYQTAMRAKAFERLKYQANPKKQAFLTAEIDAIRADLLAYMKENRPPRAGNTDPAVVGAHEAMQKVPQQGAHHNQSKQTFDAKRQQLDYDDERKSEREYRSRR